MLQQLVVHTQKLVYYLKIYIPRCVGKSGYTFSELTIGDKMKEREGQGGYRG